VVQITNPFTTDLTEVDPDDVDQLRAPDPTIRSPEEEMAVETLCDACGCRWVVEYDVPEGCTVCAFCGASRGYLGRNASLDELTDAGDDDPETISYAWAGEPPLPRWEAVFDNTRLLVQVGRRTPSSTS